MKEIPLTKGKVALVDDSDYAALIGRRWQYHHEGYAVSTENYKQIRMHRVIMDHVPDGEIIDHINGNGLDNRRVNLRISDNSKNQANRGLLTNNTSGYKGVTYHKGKRKWMARLAHMGREFFLGYYSTKEDAAKAYNHKAVEIWGEHARLNDL
jgi:hypothetical protein